jgi:hypothetical protein
MTKRSLFLLLAAFAILSGGLFTLRGTRTRVRLSRHALEPVFRPASDVPPSPTSEPEPTIFGSRIVAVLVAAVIFGTGAYLGLGGSESVNAGAPPSASASPTVWAAAVPATTDTSFRDEIRSMLSHSATANSKASAAPTPDPAALAAAATAAPQPTPAPTPEPVPQPAAALAPLPADGLEGIICSKPWPCAEAIAVASCESGLDRNGRLDGNWATNGNNYGLFQINGVHANLWPDFYDNWMDPVKNTEWAYELWSTSGWRPWQCQP